MTDSPPIASELVAERIKEIRQRRGWTTKTLADVCAERGVPQLTASVLMNIESGRKGEDGRRRRHVTVDELLALAYVFEVSPLALLLPGEDTSYQITDEDTFSARTVYEWLAGEILPPFPFPLEGVTDEDRARAWFAFTSLVGYVPEQSAHWVVRAELERLKEREQRLVAEGRLREALENRRVAQTTIDMLVREAQERIVHLRTHLDKTRRFGEEHGVSDHVRRSTDDSEKAIMQAQTYLTDVQYRHHSLVQEIHELSRAIKNLDTGGDDGGR